MRGFWLEGESGLAEESGDEAVLSLDAVELVPYRGDQLGHGPCGEIALAVRGTVHLHCPPGRREHSPPATTMTETHHRTKTSHSGTKHG